MLVILTAFLLSFGWNLYNAWGKKVFNFSAQTEA